MLIELQQIVDDIKTQLGLQYIPSQITVTMGTTGNMIERCKEKKSKSTKPLEDLFYPRKNIRQHTQILSKMVG